MPRRHRSVIITQTCLQGSNTVLLVSTIAVQTCSHSELWCCRLLTSLSLTLLPVPVALPLPLLALSLSLSSPSASLSLPLSLARSLSRSLCLSVSNSNSLSLSLLYLSLSLSLSLSLPSLSLCLYLCLCLCLSLFLSFCRALGSHVCDPQAIGPAPPPFVLWSGRHWGRNDCCKRGLKLHQIASRKPPTPNTTPPTRVPASSPCPLRESWGFTGIWVAEPQ